MVEKGSKKRLEISMVGFEGGSKNSDQNNLEQEDGFNACF